MSEPRFVAPELPRDPEKILTRSIVSHRTGRGVVVIDWGDQHGQFDPEDARVFAHTILRECDNAETDAFVYQHFGKVAGLDGRQLAVLITELRKDRARREQLAGLRRTGDEIPEDDAR